MICYTNHEAVRLQKQYIANARIIKTIKA